MAGSPEVGQGNKYDKPLTRLKQDKVCQKKSPAGIFFQIVTIILYNFKFEHDVHWFPFLMNTILFWPGGWLVMYF